MTAAAAIYLTILVDLHLAALLNLAGLIQWRENIVKMNENVLYNFKLLSCTAALR